MPYQVELNEREGYLEADVRGERNHETSGQDALNAIATAALKCKEIGLNKIVINWHVKGKFNKGQALNLISNLEKYQWIRNLRSVSIHHDIENYKSNTFAQTVADNLGWSLRFYKASDKAIALEWLLETKASTPDDCAITY